MSVFLRRSWFILEAIEQQKQKIYKVILHFCRIQYTYHYVMCSAYINVAAIIAYREGTRMKHCLIPCCKASKKRTQNKHDGYHSISAHMESSCLQILISLRSRFQIGPSVWPNLPSSRYILLSSWAFYDWHSLGQSTHVHKRIKPQWHQGSWLTVHLESVPAYATHSYGAAA
jgi:hypothetical protein